MARIIAMRREAQSKVVFFRQFGQLVQYSFDQLNWFDGWIMPHTRTVSAGNPPYDPSKGNRWYIETYRRKYYQDTPIKQVVNNFNLTFNRTTIINNGSDLNESHLTPGKICTALRAFLIQAREYGLAVRNGHLERDDFRSMWNIGGTVVGAGATVLLANPIGAGAAAIGGAAIGAVIVEDGGEELEDALIDSSMWTDEDLQTYLCCLWDELKDGNFNYQDFVTAGSVTCGIGAWDEIATPELYASFIASLKHFEVSNSCVCETCKIFKPTEGEILTGFVTADNLLTQNNPISGSLRRMQSRVRFTIPNQVITEVYVKGILSPYENISDPVAPTVQFISAGTGGGNTTLTTDFDYQALNPSHFASTPVTQFDLLFQSSTCSACNTGQNALFLESYHLLTEVKVCGVLA